MPNIPQDKQFTEREMSLIIFGAALSMAYDAKREGLFSDLSIPDIANLYLTGKLSSRLIKK